MSKRKKKRKQKESEVIFSSLLILVGVTYYFTGSVKLAIVSICIVTLIWGFASFLIQKNKEDKLKQSGIHEIDKMDGIQFEYYLSTLFNSLGYKVKVTQATGDYGADLVLRKDNETIVVQAKRYANKVGIKAVQEIAASKLHYEANYAWVVTNSSFTEPAIKLAESNQVELIDRKKLIELILKINPNTIPSASEVIETVSTKKANVYCPRCNSEMVIRKGKSSFYGCSKFPKCKGTREI